MLDEDDVEAIALTRALADVIDRAQRLADPEQGLWAYMDMVTAVLMHQQCPGRPLSWVMLLCARRTIHDIELAL